MTSTGLNDGKAMTVTAQTVSADGDNIITMLTTKDTLLAVTAEVYGDSAIIHAETNKRMVSFVVIMYVVTRRLLT